MNHHPILLKQLFVLEQTTKTIKIEYRWAVSIFYLLQNTILTVFFYLALDFRTAVKTVRKNFPVSSYSSSDDDDDFYDADETME